MGSPGAHFCWHREPARLVTEGVARSSLGVRKVTVEVGKLTDWAETVVISGSGHAHS